MKVITPLQTYQLYYLVKFAFNGKYDINKRGVTYMRKFGRESFDKSYMKYQITKFNKNYPTQEEALNIFSSNFVRDPNRDIYKINPDDCIKMRKYYTSSHDYKDDTIDIFRKYTLGDLLNRNTNLLLQKLTSGEIPPEWFCLTDRLLPLSSYLDEQPNILWDVLKNRLTTYRFFVKIESVERLKEMRSFLLATANKSI